MRRMSLSTAGDLPGELAGEEEKRDAGGSPAFELGGPTIEVSVMLIQMRYDATRAHAL
jgi:hypothetical protein